jgi:hypothetical protein
MPLTGAQLQELKQALSAAFNEYELRDMVLGYLGRNLEAIARGDNLDKLIFELVTWAERRGYTPDLLKGARSYNSTNPTLRAFMDKYPELLLDVQIGEDASGKDSDRTSIEIVVAGEISSDDTRSQLVFYERALNTELSIAQGTIKIIKMEPTSSIGLLLNSQK